MMNQTGTYEIQNMKTGSYYSAGAVFNNTLLISGGWSSTQGVFHSALLSNCNVQAITY